MNFSSALLGKRSLNDTLSTFTFARPPTMDFKAGQFVMMSFDKDFNNPHPFSISSSPSDEFLEISARKLGGFTTYLHTIPLGTSVWFKGPFGMFTLDRSEGDVVMIAGGVGITPFLSIIRYAHSTKLKRKISLIYSARTEADLLEKDTFDGISEQSRRISINYILSQEKPEETSYKTGTVDKAFIEANVKKPSAKAFYLCGPPPMVAALRQALGELGVKEDNVFVDNWDFAKKIAEVIGQSPEQKQA